MKPTKLLFGLFILIFTFTTSCQKEDDSLENPIYPSNAKLKRILGYSTMDPDKPISIVEEYEYDEKGRISKVSSPMYQDGVIVGTIRYDLYEYNSQGQLIKIENYNANSNSPTGFINLKNYTYTYSNNGKKEKEYIEYPQIGSFSYTLYKYDKGILSRIEKYGRDSDDLENYVVNEYDKLGNLVKETAYRADNQPYSYTQHSYEKGLNIQSDIFGGEGMKIHAREIFKTYDENNNLIIKESNELLSYSSSLSYVLRYEYFEK